MGSPVRCVAVVVLALASAVAGCGRREAPRDDGDDPPGKSADAGATVSPESDPGCDLGAESILHVDTTIKAGCHVVVARNYEVQSGVTLTIEPGARLAFGHGMHLWIGYGRLVAQGTAEQPVVFTSLDDKSPQRGDWEGLVFAERAREGSVLEHVVVEYAGNQGSLGSGALSFYGAVKAGVLAVRASTFRHNAQAAVAIAEPGSTLVAFEDNTLQDNVVSLAVPASVLRTVGKNAFGDPLKVRGAVTSSQSWPAFDAPVRICGNLSIAGVSERATLTLAEGTTLAFEKGAHLTVGGGVGGALVAKGVTFTSASDPKAPGDWVGIGFDAGAVGGSSLDGCTVAFAGRDDGSVVYLGGPLPKLLPKQKQKVPMTSPIKNTKFEHVKGAAIHVEGPTCGELASEKNGNTTDGAELCTSLAGAKVAGE